MMTGPEQDRQQRAAIMFTDIVGYTRMMAENEPRTIRLLKMHAGMVAGRVTEHNGKVLERIGDAFMIRFDLAAQAVACAMAIQADLAAYNQKVLPQEEVHIRIGIHCGELVERDHELFGSVINIAARLQPLALTDGITISRFLLEEASPALDIAFESFGPTSLKNVIEKVEVLHLVTPQVSKEAIQRELTHRKESERKYRNRFMTSVGIAIVMLILTLVFFQKPEMFGYERAPGDSALIASNRIAVMPLRNVTGDSMNNYICEGVAEDLIFKLMKVPGLHVYPLGDIMALNQSNRTTRGIKRNLGAKFLVQGTLFRADDSLSVKLEIIDTETSKRVFSVGYADARENRMQLQDKIARDMLFPIVGRISGETEASLALHAPSNPVAADFFLQARHAERNAYSWEDYQNVIRLYESAVQADSQFALAHAELAAAYAKVYGRWDNDARWISLGRRRADRALALASDLPEAHFADAIVLVKENKLDAAEQAYLEALSYRSYYRSAFNGLGSLFLRQGRYPEAISLFERALTVSNELGDLQGKWFANHFIGHIHASRGDYPEALEYLGKAVVLARETGSQDMEATTLNRLGVVYKWLGDYTRAIQAYEKALTLQREINDLAGQSVTLNSIGSYQYTQGHYEDALDYYKQALDIRKRIGAYLRPAYNNIGATFNSMGLPDSALVYQQKALEIAREARDPRGEGYALENMGYIYRNMGRFEDALENFQRSLEIDRELGLKRQQGYALAAIASTYRRMGRFQPAVSFYRESLTIRQEIGDKRNTALTRGWVGDVYMQLQTYPWALDEYYQALTIWKELEQPDEIHRVLLNIAECRYQLGEYDAARDTLTILLQPKVDEGVRPFARLLLGACDVGQGQAESGLVKMNKVLQELKELEEYGYMADGYLILAQALMDMGRPLEAETALDSCVAVAEYDHLDDRISLAKEMRAKLLAQKQ